MKKFYLLLIAFSGLVIKNLQHIPEPQPKLIGLYNLYATDNVPPKLLRAVAIVESGENINAFNSADPAFGLMQILYTGHNKLNVDGWPPNNPQELYNPEYNIKIGAQILDYDIKKYGFFRGIVTYNNWSARNGLIPMASINYFLKVFTTYLRL